MSAGGAVDRGALVNAAWQGGAQTPSAPATAASAPATAAGGQEQGDAPASSQPQSEDPATQAAAAEQPTTPGVLTAPGAEGVDAAAQDGQIGTVDQPAASAERSSAQKIVGRTAAGLGVVGTILSTVLYVFRARLF